MKAVNKSVTPYVCLAGLVAAASLLSGATSSSPSVTLNVSVVPSMAQPGVSNISVTGSGFPSGVLAPANVIVTFTPVTPAAGPTASTPVSTIVSVIGTTRRMTAAVPATLLVSTPTAYTVSLSDTVDGFGSTNANLTINPPASLLSAGPNSGTQGQTFTATMTGQYSHFLQGGTSVSVAGAGVAVSAVSVLDSTHVTAQFAIDPNATLGAHAITVTSGAEVVSLSSGLSVMPGTATILNIAPASGVQGQSLNVVVNGQSTNFVQGTTLATFGAGIIVNSVTVNSPVSATVNITLDPTAALGTRSITLATGSSVATATGAFTIGAGAAAISSVTPASGIQGQSLNVVVAGSGTHFLSGITAANFGAGITVSNVVVTSSTSATVSLVVASNAVAGSRQVTLTTVGETASLFGGFTVGAGTPAITLLTPASAQQGASLNVTIAGQFTHFVQGATTASFGAGVTVNSVAVASATSATAAITIDPTAFTGLRSVTVTTGAEAPTAANAFQISAGSAAILASTPASGLQGQTLSVTVTGSATNFSQGVTAASFGAGITVSTLTVNSATSATALLLIDPAAAAGTRTITFTTAGQTAMLAAGFTVNPGVPAVLSIAPNSGVQGQSIATVSLVGMFTHWVNGTTVANFGANVTVNSLTVVDATHATASILIDPLATTGARNVTLTTGVEIATLPGGFTVQAGSAAISSVAPNSGMQGQSLSVVVTGSGTHFAQGVTVANFGPGVTVSTLTVNSLTNATAQLSIAAGAGLGIRNVSLTTAGETANLAGAFNVTLATPVISSVTPSSGSQGQNLNVAVVGQFTHFAQGTTAATFGAGVTVNSVTVVDATHLTASVSIAGVATTGTRNVTITTGAEVVTSSFSVSSSSATLLSLAPNQGMQGQVLTGVVITGQGTNFSQATSVLTVGSGVTVTNLNVTSLTTATATLTIGAGAALGARSAVMTTGGEVAALNGAFTVSSATPVLSSINPAAGQQGVTLGVNLTGQFTHFAQGTTTVNFGGGIAVNSVTVSSATSATANITIQPTTTLGPRTVTVTTGAELVSITNAFQVNAGNAVLLSVSPSSGIQGQTVNVIVSGSGTNFLQGTTIANFGAGIVVSSLTVNSPTNATASLAIDPAAAAGVRSVTFTTAGETATLNPGFSVVTGTPALTSVVPSTGVQGQTLSVALVGQFSHFVNGTTTATFGAGITVNTLTVADSTHATVSITVGPLAALGSRVVTVTTGAEILSTGANGFSVSAGPAAISSLTPNSGQQGQTVNVAIIGTNTNFAQGTTAADFGSGTSISSLTVTSATSASAVVIVDPAAVPGFRTVTLSTGGQVASIANGFTVIAGTPVLISSAPNSGTQGQTVASIAIVGQFTHFVNGTTTAVFGSGIVVNSLTVVDATHAIASVTVDPLANVGARSLIATTGGEIVTLNNAFTVQASGAAISSVTPNSASQGQSLAVNITGTGTHFAQGNTSAGFGPGISVTTLTVNSPTSATAQISVSAGAGVGLRSITLTTGGESASLANAFTVVAATPVFVSATPATGTQGQANLAVAIVGQFTNFVQGTTTVTFGAGITVNSVTVADATHVSANISISPTANAGGYSIVVNTGAETVSGGFSVTSSSAVLLSLTPNSGSQGQTVTSVAIVGQGTHFAQGTSALSVSGITVNNFVVTSATTATADLVIPAGAGIGSHSATVSTGGENASLINAFTVVAATPVISTVSPASAAQGATVAVAVTGQFTHFVQGTTTVSFGTGVTVNSVTVSSATALSVNITVPATSNVGGRTITVTTTAEVVTSSFSVIAGPAVLLTVAPNTAAQGASVASVVITGQATHFAQGTTVANFGGGVTVNSLTVNSATSATANITIDPATSAGFRTVSLTTAGESASLTNGFIITAATPVLTSVAPTSGQQGQALASVTLSAQFTHFVQGTTVIDFGAGIAVGTVTVNSPTSATVSLTISPTANTGFRNVTATTGVEVVTLTSGFSIQPGPAVINTLAPANGPQGGSNIGITITGTNTNFLQGTTVATFGAGITVNSLTVTSLTVATANIGISPTATPGQRTVTLTTGGQNASTASGFTIVAATPVLTLTAPTTGIQGLTNANIAVTGQFTNFVQGTTVADFGAGITINSVTVVDLTHATVNISIGSTANVGVRNVTLTTNAETETLTNGFTVQSGTATISSLTPASARQAQTIDIAIVGTNTNFANGTTTASFGASVNVNTLTITSATTATANITVQAGAATGTRTVTLTTAGENASIANGFTITPGLPAITLVAPTTGHQADTNLNITLTGQFTTFVQGTTTGSFGAGITVNSVTVTNATSAIANITISAAAAPGSRTVILTTGVQTAQSVGGFTVTAGLPSIISASPASAGQGLSLTVVIAGQFTNFAAGQTAISFGSGVTPGVVTVNGPTDASVPITIAPGATLGARTITATTGSEVAVLTNGFTITAGAPSITLINPNTGQPAQTLTVALTGLFSNWVNGVTRATFGAGISVGGAANGAPGLLTVNSATQATASLVIDPAAVIAARDVVVTTNAETETVISGFTVQQNNATPPTLLSISPSDNATNVPLNTAITVQFSKPMDRTTFIAANIYLYDTVTGKVIPTTVTVDASGRIATLVPTQLLPVSRLFYTYLTNGLKDTSGNALGYQLHYFTTGFNTDTTGPALISSNISNGDTNIALNAKVNLQFSKAINPVSQPAGISVQTGGITVPGTYTFFGGNTQVFFTPANPLTASTVYTVLYNTQLTDAAGNGLTNPGNYSFTSGTAADTTAPTILSYSPAYNQQGVGTNAVIKVVFSEPINPISLTSFLLYNQNNSQPISATILVASNRLSAILTPNAPLASLTGFYFQLYSYQDLAGNNGGGVTVYFTTGTGSDTTAPTVSGISPVNGATGVPVNTKIVALLNEPIDLTSITNASIQLTPSVAGTVALATDQVTLTFTPTANLAVSTAYTVSVNGFRDTSGNTVTPFGSTFTTGSSATPDLTRPSITSTIPANGATNVALNSPITLVFSEPMNPSSFFTNVASNSFALFANVNSVSTQISGAFTVTNTASSSTFVFTPASPLPAGASVTFYAVYNTYPTDYAGNLLNNYSFSFTTVSGTDTTPPTVTSVTPPNGATAVGQNTPIVITFSEPLNPSSVNNNTFALFNGSTRINPGISRSPDNRTITLTTTLPASSLITIVVTSGVTDLVGNPLADFSSQFTSAPTPPTGHPNVISQRPGSGSTGIPANTQITLITDTPLKSSTVSGALHVSQNGVLVSGTVTSNGQSVVFTPATAFLPGALIQIFLDSNATDNSGNSVNNYNGQFTVQANLTGVGPTVSALSPTNATQNAALNTIVDIQFTKPLDPTTVNGSTFFLKQNDAISVPATVSLLSPMVVRIAPTSALTGAGTPFYRINITTAVKDTQGNAYTGPNASYYFYTSPTSVSDTVAPTVTSVSPADNSTNVGDNATIRVTFSEPVDVLTVTAASILVSGGAYTVMPSTIAFSASNQTVTITPQIPLPDNTQLTVAIAGVTDLSGNNVVPLTTHFTTGPGADTVKPYVIFSSIQNGATNVPVNSVFVVQFSEPVDPLLLTGTNFSLYDPSNGTYLPVNRSFSPDGLTATINSTSPLPVGRFLYLFVYNAQDLAGNNMTNSTITFTTSFTPDSVPPLVSGTNPVNGATGVPINTQIQILFNEPIQATSLSGVTLSGIPFARTLTNGDRTLLLVPGAPLAPSTAYTITIAGVKDISGNALAGTVTSSFTTGPGADLVPPVITSTNPIYNETNVGRNVVIRANFSEPIDQLTVDTTNFRIANVNNNVFVPGTVAVAANRLSATFTPSAPLLAGTQYYFQLYSYTDLAGNAGNGATIYFTTGTSTDVTPPTVTTISPANGTTQVPVNARVLAIFSEAVDPTSVTNTSLQFTPAVAGTATLATDLVTLTFVPTAALAASTNYSVAVAGIRDASGNTMAPFSSAFTTSASAVLDTTRPSVTSISPLSGAAGVALNSTITFNISEPLDPASVRTNTGTGNDTFAFFANNGVVSTQIGGTLTLTNTAITATVVFTPSNPLPANSTVNIYAVYNTYPTDLAGNQLNNFSASFTTANGTDTTPPTVTSVTPSNNATGAGQQQVVSLTISEALNPNTINGFSFALFSGATQIGANIGRSSDNRTVTLSATLPVSSLITVVATSAATDLAGNHLVDFTSQFNTGASPQGTHPNVITQRPGNGATGVPNAAPIYLLTDAGLSAATVPAALHVSQNGVLVSGTTQVSGNGQSILFTPSAPLTSGAVIQIFLDANATDNFGNSVNAYTGQFTVTPNTSLTGPTVAVLGPPNGTNPAPLSTVVDIQFTKPIDPTTVNASNFFLKLNDVTLISSTVTQISPNVVRIKPNALLTGTASPYYRINIAAGVKDTQGNAYTGPVASYYFYTSPASITDTVSPTVTGIAPTDNSTGIGDNASIRATFSEPIDPASVTAATFSVTASGFTLVPSSISFGNNNQDVTITPQAPLPDATVLTIGISGITDPSGNAVTPFTSHFTTGTGTDSTRPFVISSSVSPNATGVPVNSVFTFRFSEPVDTRALNLVTNFYVYDNTTNVYLPATRSFTPDGLSATIVTTSNLPASRFLVVGAINAQDLAGNLLINYNAYFTTSAASDTTPPLVTAINPGNGTTGVPINAALQVLFNEAIQPTAVSQVTLSAGANVPVTVSVTNGNSTLTLTPSAPLLPNTTYTITATGVKDTAGNTMAGSTTSIFTTGPGALLSRPSVLSSTPPTGTTGVPVSVAPQVVFNAAINPLSAYNNVVLLLTNTSANVPVTLSFSPDYKTVTLTPTAALSAATQYSIRVNAVTDQAGNTLANSLNNNFTTQ